MKPRMAQLAAAAVVLVGLASSAHATSIRQLDLDALVGTADLIVLAVVGPSHSAAIGKRFVTRVELTPERVIKGAVEGPVVVETPGGTMGGIGQRVAGSARFVEGEQVIVFLTRLAEDRYRVRGMAQGKLTVVPGIGGGRVVRDLSGLSLVGDGGEPRAAGVDEMPLDDFVRDLAVRVVRSAGNQPPRPGLLDGPRIEPPTVAPADGAPGVVDPRPAGDVR